MKIGKTGKLFFETKDLRADNQGFAHSYGNSFYLLLVDNDYSKSPSFPPFCKGG